MDQPNLYASVEPIPLINTIHGHKLSDTATG